MTPRKFSLHIATFSYGGVGASNNTHPSPMRWLGDVKLQCSRDDRIERIVDKEYADTPITMCRNAAIYDAMKSGADMLLMVDSDMEVDCEPDGKPFWQTSFDFFCQHYDRGPSVICAPYCGPPPEECVYVFRWTNQQNDDPNAQGQVRMYPRDVASQMQGFGQIAACPTGVILFDTRIFELTAPRVSNDLEALRLFKDGAITEQQVLKLIKQHSWCYYEYTDAFERQKASTEDVTLTRDLSFAGLRAYGYNPLYCNWDAWAGHYKPKCVRKPKPWNLEDIVGQMRETLMNGASRTNRLMDVVPTALSARMEHSLNGNG